MDKQSIQQLLNLKSQSSGTTLITYHINGNSSLWLAIEKLNYELSTANNIKSKQVKKDVEKALKSAIYKLKNYKQNFAPDNGLVLCSGSVLENNCCV